MDIYLLIENQKHGPYEEDQLRQSLLAGQIPNDLPAWHDGLDDWVQVGAIIKAAPDAESSLAEHEVSAQRRPRVDAIEDVGVSPSVSLTTSRRNRILKFLAVGMACLVGMLILGISMGIGIWLVASRIPTPNKDGAGNGMAQSSASEDQEITDPETLMKGFVAYIREEGIANFDESATNLKVTQADYTIQQTGVSPNRLLAEVRITILLDPDSTGLPQGLGTGSSDLKVFLTCDDDGRYWKIVRIADAKDEPSSDDDVWIKNVTSHLQYYFTWKMINPYDPKRGY